MGGIDGKVCNVRQKCADGTAAYLTPSVRILRSEFLANGLRFIQWWTSFIPYTELASPPSTLCKASNGVMVGWNGCLSQETPVCAEEGDIRYG